MGGGMGRGRASIVIGLLMAAVAGSAGSFRWCASRDKRSRPTALITCSRYTMNDCPLVSAP